MTKETDKLLAISGLAMYFYKVTGDTYYAGLWKRDLFRALRWQYYYALTVLRPSAYIAPSWSWASSEKINPEINILCKGVTGLSH